jgi:hypothetical protein
LDFSKEGGEEVRKKKDKGIRRVFIQLILLFSGNDDFKSEIETEKKRDRRSSHNKKIFEKTFA